MLSFKQLTTALTSKQGIDLTLEWLQAFGFQTTGWQNGRIQKTLVTVIGTLVADFSEVVRFMTLFGYNETATGDAMEEFSKSRFGNTKEKAVKTAGPMRLTSTSSVPYTIVPGQLLATTADGIEFRNTTGGVLAAGSTASPSSLVLQWEARLAGDKGNVGNSEVSKLVTALAGVTISNAEANPWYTTTGKDEESDANIRLRNLTQWARLTVELVEESYINIALSNGARKVKVDATNPRGAGTLDVYCASETSEFKTPEAEAMQLVFSQAAFQTDAAWPPASDSRVYVKKPTAQPLGITATLYHDPNVDESEITDRAEQALEDFLRLTPIGGWIYSATLQNVITREALVGILTDVEGVISVKLTTPAADVAVGTLNLVTKGSWSLPCVASAA